MHFNAHGLKISVDYVVFLRFIASWIRTDQVSEEEFTLRGPAYSSPKHPRAEEDFEEKSEIREETAEFIL